MRRSRLQGWLGETHHHQHDTEQQEHAGAEAIRIIKEKDLGGSKMRAGKEERTRDPHLSQRQTTMLMTVSSSRNYCESKSMPCDVEQESQRNPLP